MFKQSTLALGLVLSTVLGATSATAAQGNRYEVVITNITPGQTFTPQLVVTHSRDAQIFNLGAPASEELEILAEGGDTGPLADALAPVANDAVTIGGLLEPGMSASTIVHGNPGRDLISVAAMLIPTNDTFMALNAVQLPRNHRAVSYMVPGYDAGTEVNDQSCQNIPGPRCNIPNAGFSPEGGEGFVHIGNGFHELGDVDEDGFEVLGPQVYDWRNSVAQITVRRLKN